MINARERAEKLTQERRIRMASQRTSRSLSGEENPTRVTSISSPKNDVKVSPMMFGQFINRPTSGTLLKSGTKGFMYVSTDLVEEGPSTQIKLSAWTGSAWVKVNLTN